MRERNFLIWNSNCSWISEEIKETERARGGVPASNVGELVKCVLEYS